MLGVFRELSNKGYWQQIVHMYKSIALGHIAVNMSVTGFGAFPVSCWCVRIYFSSLSNTLFYTSYLVEMKPDKFVARWLYCDVWSSIVTNLRKNYPRSSIGRSPHLKAEVVVNKTRARSPPWVNDFCPVYKWWFWRDLHKSAM